MSIAQVNDGLLFVYGECGPNVTEEEFNDWYDNEHAPARVAFPGFSSATRYKATDGKSPTWLAIYDVSTAEFLQSDEYKALNANAAANASANEKSIVSRLTVLNRSIYSRIITVQNPDISATALPPNVTVVVGMQPALDKEEDLNAYFEEEHLPLLLKIPGFIRARRYKLVSGSAVELAGKADVNSPAVAFPYITLCDCESEAYMAEPALKEAGSTPWSIKVWGELEAGPDFRLFAIHKSFSK